MKKILSFFNSEELKIFLFFLIVYGVFVSNNIQSNEGSRIALTYSIVDYKTFSIDKYVNLTYFIDCAKFNDHYYSDKPPASSFLAIPAYLVIKLFTIENLPTQIFLITFTTTTLFGSLLCTLFYKFTKNFTQNFGTRFLTTIALGLGTIAFPFSTAFFSHQISSFFIFLSFYLLYVAKKNKKENYIILAGLFTAVSFLMDYLVGIIIIPFAIYAFSFKKKMGLLQFLFPFIILSSLALLYNYLIFGNIFKFPYNYACFYKETHQKGFYGIFFPNPSILIELLIKPHRGLFIFSPILIFSFIGFSKFLRSKFRIEAIIFMLTFLLFLLTNSGYSEWTGGWSYGPRFLIPTLPFLCLMLIPSFEIKKQKRFALVLLIISIFISFTGTATNITPGAENPIYNALTVEKFGQRSYYLKFISDHSIPLIFSYLLPIFTIIFLFRKELRNYLRKFR
jgi:MFS family permease